MKEVFEPNKLKSSENEDRDLERILGKAWQVATEELGMEPEQIDFHLVPASVLYAIAAREGIAERHQHWNFGKQYKDNMARQEIGRMEVYELVADELPNQAYLLESNPFIVNVLVGAHVLGHSEFFNKNKFAKSARKDISGMERAFQRLIGEKEGEYGRERVEKLLDALTCFNAVPLEAEAERPYGEEERVMWKDEESFPPVPDRDVLGFIRNHGYLEDWEREIVDYVRQEGIYFNSLKRTKFMNEGWAAFNHKKIMRRLQEDNYVASTVRAEWWDLHAGVLSPGRNKETAAEDEGAAGKKEEIKFSPNPYNVGMGIFEYIEDLHNGNLSEEEKDLLDRDVVVPARFEGDIKDSPGYREARRVMESEDDLSFIGKYYNRIVAKRLGDADWPETKTKLMLSDKPVIEVVDVLEPISHNGETKGRKKLYLRHVSDGRRLDRRAVSDTLPKIADIWGGTVKLEAVISKNKKGDGEEVVFTYLLNTGVESAEKKLWISNKSQKFFKYEDEDQLESGSSAF